MMCYLQEHSSKLFVIPNTHIIQCAYRFGLPVAIKSGGHSFPGYSSITSPGFMINLGGTGALRQVTWTNDTVVTVDAGATWSDVLQEFRTFKKIYWGLLSHSELICLSGLLCLQGSRGSLGGHWRSVPFSWSRWFHTRWRSGPHCTAVWNGC
jgi:FAD/FMN-containing dehydrogenase